jgi:hypothetical protein
MYHTLLIYTPKTATTPSALDKSQGISSDDILSTSCKDKLYTVTIRDNDSLGISTLILYRDWVKDLLEDNANGIELTPKSVGPILECLKNKSEIPCIFQQTNGGIGMPSLPESGSSPSIDMGR